MKRKSFSIVIALIAALSLIMLMTAISFAAEGDTGSVGFGENFEQSASIKVGETAVINVSNDWNGKGISYYPESGVILVDKNDNGSGYIVTAKKPGTETI